MKKIKFLILGFLFVQTSLFPISMYAAPTIYDDGSTLEVFDDGSTLATGTDGSVTSSPATDSSVTSTTSGPTTGGAAPSGGCTYNDGESVSDALKRCKPNKVLSASGDDYTFDGGARERVIQLANQLILVGSLLAVAAIVYGAVMYTISGGDDDRVKTAKGSLKFGVIGFVAMLLSFPLVNAIVRLFFTTSGS